MIGKAGVLSLVVLVLTGCSNLYAEDVRTKEWESVLSAETAGKTEAKYPMPEMERTANIKVDEEQDRNYVSEGTEKYHEFVVDSVLHSSKAGDIHYCVFIPDGYDGRKEYSLYLTLPGYQGLYFQGAGMNLQTEEFGFEAQKYHDDMIILAPQLEDWGETSAWKTIALTEYFLEHYPINQKQVYISGYSGGGETLSLVLDQRPELYTAALMCSSQWDGGYEAIVRTKTPVYFVTGESDEYYGTESFEQAYQEIRRRYQEEGLSETEADNFVVLDIKPTDYFTDGGVTSQHGGGSSLFCRDSTIMGWLFGMHDK